MSDWIHKLVKREGGREGGGRGYIVYYSTVTLIKGLVVYYIVMYHYTQCGIHFATHCCILLYFIIMTSFNQTMVS